MHPRHFQFSEDNNEENNNGPKLPSNALIATLDVITLYTNIAHEEGLAYMKEKLD